jgi:hypothetical protein
VGTKPVTRWQQTRADWRGFQGAREASIAVIGAAIATGVLLILGFPDDAVVTGVTVAGTAFAGAIIWPLGDLWWCWLKAPARMLKATQEKNAQLEADARAADDANQEAQTTLRKLLLAYKSRGAELYAQGGANPYEPATVEWTDDVLAALTKYGTQEQVEQFSSAGSGTAGQRLSGRRYALDQILASMNSEQPAPT